MLYNMINPPKPLNNTRKKVPAISKHAYVFYRVKIWYIFEIRVILEILYEAHLYLLRTGIYQWSESNLIFECDILSSNTD